MAPIIHQPDPQLDLVFERIVDVSPELVWAAWTTPEHLKHWFTPAPWKTIDCEIDLRPGGLFRTVMCSPEGQEFPNIGCYLEVIPNKKLVWTNALQPGYRPVIQSSEKNSGNFPFTAALTLEPHEQGTKYTAIVIHGNREDCKKHEDMGFYDGWGKIHHNDYRDLAAIAPAGFGRRDRTSTGLQLSTLLERVKSGGAGYH